MGLFSNTMNKLFGTHSQREVKSITPIVDRIEALGDTYKAMSEAELKSQTDVLKGRLQKGESLDDILPDAFAVMPRGCRSCAGYASLSGAAHRRHHPPSGPYRRDENR